MVVGLTGGIGSGKTTVAGFFKNLGVSVYIADKAAKRLMHTDPDLRAAIIKLLGDNAYKGRTLNSSYISDRVFTDPLLLTQLNQLVHPVVGRDFKNWKQNHKKEGYVIKEAAILFENGGYKKCDFTILVTAPKQVRIDRVVARDQTTEQKVLQRIAAQWSDTRKRTMADLVIENVGLSATRAQVLRAHEHLERRVLLGY